MARPSLTRAVKLWTCRIVESKFRTGRIRQRGKGVGNDVITCFTYGASGANDDAV
eukprot:CAMPEP_0175075110 /NCGR_PEP_ID=MMETSP0052_2-20121109/21778_1 /TAXON_ID=51329 ORGANISM="Polytomella parva, Strain SAG 63-3" /NCGR_SAMPLE_ID=MMETSP0052_2 /ASSEMBLY_ACC=CAM_ASM_000194 /LENGTH=54 /DNA_ID=CAMNT_0016343679 /DNA_START=51 /DNA_END=212 /DNA_ORIENTATION=+